jgi:hypothetical protein
MNSLFRGARSGEPIEERIARLEDVEAISNLKATYAYWCDHGYAPDRLAALFTEDAVWESNIFGPFEGRAAIRGYFADLAEGEIRWAHHCMIAPVIAIAEGGEAATGSWYLLDLATFANATEPPTASSVVATANYEDTFAKQDGEWRFSRIRATFHQISDLDQGWARQQFRGEAPESSAGDAVRTGGAPE